MIDTAGKDFDPNVHEAMMQVASDEHETGKVVERVREGIPLERQIAPSGKGVRMQATG